MKFNSQRLTLGVRFTESDKGDGLLVEDVTRGSAASDAGVKAGDLLMKIDGESMELAGVKVGIIALAVWCVCDALGKWRGR